MVIPITDKKFHYTNAADSAKPNYLRNRFRQIERERREREALEAAKPSAIIRPIKKEGK